MQASSLFNILTLIYGAIIGVHSKSTFLTDVLFSSEEILWCGLADEQPVLLKNWPMHTWTCHLLPNVGTSFFTFILASRLNPSILTSYDYEHARYSSSAVDKKHGVLGKFAESEATRIIAIM